MGVPLRTILLSALLALATGCAHYHVNQPIESAKFETGYRFKESQSPTNSNKLFVILTFSGGGTRAAALSYGVLEELKKAELVIDGQKRRLVDEIDLISSVSGGSFTSAYYGLFGDRIFDDFAEKFLYRNVQGKLARMLISPWVWFRLGSPNYNRDDMASDLYHKEIFDGKTFADLAMREQAPFLMINATDISLGARFEFTQPQFDLLCSDLSEFPVARAVTASSAVPGLFGTVLIKNHPDHCGNASPAWVARILDNPDASLRLLTKAREAESYADSKRRTHIQLVDGGVSDNLGVRGPLDVVLKREVTQNEQQALTVQHVEKIVVITVNAFVEKDRGYTFKKSLGLFGLLSASVNIPMNRYSYESLELLQETLYQRASDIRQLRAAAGSNKPFDVYPVYLQFNNLPNQADSDFFKTMPTSFKLKRGDVDRLRSLARTQLSNHRNYRKLLTDLGATQAGD